VRTSADVTVDAVSDDLVLGIDIGGTGIKGAPVDVGTGQLTTKRKRILTPHPATPSAVATVVGELMQHFEWTGPVGCTFPAVVKRGVVLTAANVDKRWIGTDAVATFAAAIPGPLTVLNDADAAGLAEVTFGVGKGVDGVVLMITLGTGIGCGLFVDGTLVPNTELGHIEIGGKDAEKQAAFSVRERKHLSWPDYGKRVTTYLQHLDALLWPDLVIIGGGASRDGDKLLRHLDVRPKVVIASLENEAGIVGAALAAHRRT
jgi:polyphosphate glucokinase